MKWDMGIFINNIDTLINVKCGGKSKAFNERIGLRDAATRWRTTELKPSLDSLINICNEFNCSIEWLFIDHNTNHSAIKESDSGYNHDAEPPEVCGWTEDIRRACRQVKKILESDHPVIKPALISNLAAFEHSIDKEKEHEEKISDLTKSVRYLEKLHNSGKRTGTD